MLAPEYQLVIDLDLLMRADAESFYGTLLKARQGAWLSPNDVREITGWPRVADAKKTGRVRMIRRPTASPRRTPAPRRSTTSRPAIRHPATTVATKSSRSAGDAMHRTDHLPHPTDPEFDEVRSQLARAFIAHKADLGVAFADDAVILQRVDDIAWLLLGQLSRAFLSRDEAWLQQYQWFADLAADLLVDAVDRLDG